MKHLARPVLAFLLVAALGAPVALGHIGGQPFILVPADHVMPGEPFSVIAADLGPEATVTLQVLRGEEFVHVGTATAGPDGHFETSIELPTGFPHGYMELVATGSDGSEATTWILVGPRDESTGAPAIPTQGQAEWWADPSVLFLGALLAGAAGALAYVVLRRRRPTPAPVTARRGGGRPVPTKPRKARRRAT